jgi:hypothetical protein
VSSHTLTRTQSIFERQAQTGRVSLEGIPPRRWHLCRLLLVHLVRYQGQNEFGYPTVRRLALDTGSSRASVARGLRDLARLELVHTVAGKRGRWGRPRLYYTVCLPPPDSPAPRRPKAPDSLTLSETIPCVITHPNVSPKGETIPRALLALSETSMSHLEGPNVSPIGETERQYIKTRKTYARARGATRSNPAPGGADPPPSPDNELIRHRTLWAIVRDMRQRHRELDELALLALVEGVCGRTLKAQQYTTAEIRRALGAPMERAAPQGSVA